jgi:hypothetical protein
MNQIMGGIPEGLNIAVVNDYSSYQCSNFSESNFCQLNEASCYIVNELSDQNFIKSYYKTYEDALENAKIVKTTAILRFNCNFTANFQKVMDATECSTLIQVHLDFTDLRIVHFTKLQIFYALKNFTDKMIQNCGLSKSFGHLPIAVDLMNDGSVKEFQIPGLIVL